MRRHPVARLNQVRMQTNYEILSHSTDQDGQPLTIETPRFVARGRELAALQTAVRAATDGQTEDELSAFFSLDGMIRV